MNYYRTVKFIDLQRKWYSKLSKSGFKDIEYFDKFVGNWIPNPYLTPSIGPLRHIYQPSKEEFYRCARLFTYIYPFKEQLHRQIWEVYAEGMGPKGIAEHLGIPYYNVWNRIYKDLRPKLQKWVRSGKLFEEDEELTPLTC